MVGAGSGFHADQERRQVGKEFEQFGAGYVGADQQGFAELIYAMDGSIVLCKVNANGYDCHDVPCKVS